MIILKKDIKHGQVSLKTEDIDDLWYLSQLIDPGDFVTGKTLRKIKQLAKNQQTVRIEKRAVFLKLKVEKVEFHEYSDILRVAGTVEEGPDDIPKSSHHTFNVDVGTKITIVKEKWFNYQLKRLKEASTDKDLGILICTMDRDSAHFALLKRQGFKLLSEFEGDVIKKVEPDSKESKFYSQITKQLEQYVERYKIKHIILASPAFWKQDLVKQIKDDKLKQKITFATCNSVGKQAITEVLKRDEVKNVLGQDRITREIKIVETLLEEISKNNLAVYGYKQTKQAANIGAVSDLLLTTDFIHEKRQSNSFSEVDQVLKLVESMKAQIHIINSKNPGGKKLDGLGGIAAILRYKIGI